MNHQREGSPDERVRGTVPPDGGPLDQQPKWRRDFPIDVESDEYVSRRDLVKFMIVTSAAFAVGQSWLAVRSILRGSRAKLAAAAVAKVGELEVGSGKTFTYPAGSTPRLLIKTGPKSFVAYDQQCTHLQCPVIPAVDQGKLHCPCHNGWFDLHTGQPLAGPPRRRLPRVSVEVRDDTVYATGVEDS